MKSVWVLIFNDFYSQSIVGVFETRDEALKALHEYVKEYNRKEIETYYRVINGWKEDDNIIMEVDEETEEWEFAGKEQFRRLHKLDHMRLVDVSHFENPYDYFSVYVEEYFLGMENARSKYWDFFDFTEEDSE